MSKTASVPGNQSAVMRRAGRTINVQHATKQQEAENGEYLHLRRDQRIGAEQELVAQHEGRERLQLKEVVAHGRARLRGLTACALFLPAAGTSVVTAMA